jgi:hypothetical protein
MNNAFNMPQGITTVGADFAIGMFRNCSGASFTMNDAFNLPQNIVGTVGADFAARAFQECSGASFTMNSVFNMPQGITTVGADFAFFMFYDAGGSAFQINNVFKFPHLDNANLRKMDVFLHTFAIDANATTQNRSALSVLNGCKIDDDDFGVETFNGKFQDLGVIQQHFGGTGGPNGGTNREVSYEVNGEDVAISGTLSATLFTSGNSVTLSADNSTKLQRVKYMFKEWNTKADGTGNSYKDGSNIGVRNENLFLYAIWKDPKPTPEITDLELSISGKNVVASWVPDVTFTNYQLTIKNVLAGTSCIYKDATGKDQASTCTLFTPANGSNSFTAKGLFAGTYTATLTGVYDGETYTATTAASLKVPLTKGKAVAFNDIAKLSADSKNAINWMSQYGVTQGDGNGKYLPKDNVTREHMALFLYRLAGTPATVKAVPSLKDISKLSAASQTAIKWLASTGITIGTKSAQEAGKTVYWYSPSDKVTREQMALFMQRFAGIDAENGTTKIPAFPDLPPSAASKAAINWLASWGITLGASGKYLPKNNVTREQMALFMKRLATALKSY